MSGWSGSTATIDLSRLAAHVFAHGKGPNSLHIG